MAPKAVIDVERLGEPRPRRASAFRGIGPRPGFSISLVALLSSHTDGHGKRWRRPRPGLVPRGALHDDITETTA